MAARIGLQNSATKQPFFFHYFFFLFLFINVCAKVYFISLIRDTRQSNQRLQNQKQEYTTFLLAYKITEIHSSSLSFSLFHPFALQSFTFSIPLPPLSLSFYGPPTTVSLFLLYLSVDMCTFFFLAGGLLLCSISNLYPQKKSISCTKNKYL